MDAMIAVLISADFEWAATKEVIDPVHCLQNPYGEHFFSLVNERPLVFMHGGWGKISAAATTQYCIDTWHPQVIFNLGTCGGLQGQITCGETLLVNETIVYDIYERMGDPMEALEAYCTRLDLSFLREPYPMPVRVGKLASGDQDIDPQLVRHLSETIGVQAADWESSSIAWVCQHNHVPCLILRTVSDVVSETGGEIYDDNAVQFAERSRTIMADLIDHLPAWIEQMQLK